MLGNYCITALRSFKRNKLYAVINIIGLAVGMACCIAIMLFVRHETSYDKHHSKSERLYRVTRQFFNPDGAVNLHLGVVAPPFAPLLREDFPELEQVCRFMPDGSQTQLRYNNKPFMEKGFVWAEPNIFEVFTLPFIKGNPQTALSEPNSVVLTQETAERYFGTAEAIGQTIFYDTLALKVTGVMKNLPSTTHFHFDFLCSFITLKQFAPEEFEMNNWGSNNFGTYIVLPPALKPEVLEAKLPAFLDKHIPRSASPGMAQIKPHDWTGLVLQKVSDIHLHSHLDSELEENGDIRYVWIFSIVAILVLFIASVNFTNLSTARSSERSKEVGVRKTMGAYREQIIVQFLSESVLLALISLIVGILLVWLALPVLNRFAGVQLSLWNSDVVFTVCVLFIIALIVGVGAGSYPAFILSAFEPVKILRGIGSTHSRSLLRRLLVIGQFGIAVVLLVCMGVVLRQVEYCRSSNLGFTKENIVILRGNQQISERIEFIKSELQQHPGIISVAASKRIPSDRLLDDLVWSVEKNGVMETPTFRIASVPIEHSFIPTYGMTMAAGRNFSPEFGTDGTQAFILNETAVKAIGWNFVDEAIGKKFEWDKSRKGTIVGVVKDFHFESMHEKIVPMLFLVDKSSLQTLSVKVHPENLPASLEFLRSKWKTYRPDVEFEYRFLDQQFDKLYRAEEKLGQLFGVFAGIAVFVACLGLFGLAAFTAERRTKEIGIRKALGASTMNIIALLSKKFLRLVSVGFLLACPLAYFVMNKWLQTFAYHATISVYILIVAGCIALTAAMLAVLGQTIKAASGNPVNALKYE